MDCIDADSGFMRSTRTRRLRGSAVAATLAAVALLTGCAVGGSADTGADGSGTTTPAADAAAPASDARTTATVAFAQDLNTIDPAAGVDANSSIVVNNIYEPLFRLDASGQPVPAGATALPEISEDGLVLTISLNPAAVWSDGEPVTAHDYVFSWRRVVAADNAAENQRFFGFIAGANEIIEEGADAATLGVEALDDVTLQVTLTAPVPFFTALTANSPFFPVPEHFVTEVGDQFGMGSDNVLFNGPFRLEGWDGPGIGGDFTYVRNETFHDVANVALERIEVRVIREATTAVNLFRAGELDQIGISGQQVQQWLNDDAFVADTTAIVSFLGYDHAHPVLGDARVRQAISLIIDREALTDSVLAEGSVAATSLVPPGLLVDAAGTDFQAAAGNLLPTDVERAQELWAEAQADLGFDEVTIDLQTFDSDRSVTVAEYLQHVIETTLDGATVTVTASPVGVFLERTGNGEFDMYLANWAAPFPDASGHLALFTTGAGPNWGGYSNADFDAAVAAAGGELAADADARFAELLRAQEILLEDQGVTPIFYQSAPILRDPAFRGVDFRSSGPQFFFGNAYFVTE